MLYIYMDPRWLFSNVYVTILNTSTILFFASQSLAWSSTRWLVWTIIIITAAVSAVTPSIATPSIVTPCYSGTLWHLVTQWWRVQVVTPLPSAWGGSARPAGRGTMLTFWDLLIILILVDHQPSRHRGEAAQLGRQEEYGQELILWRQQHAVPAIRYISYHILMMSTVIMLDIPDGWEILCVDSAQLLCGHYDKLIVKPTEALSSQCSSWSTNHTSEGRHDFMRSLNKKLSVGVAARPGLGSSIEEEGASGETSLVNTIEVIITIIMTIDDM